MFVNLFKAPKLADSLVNTAKAVDTYISTVAETSIKKTEVRAKLNKAALIDWENEVVAQQENKMAENKATREKTNAELMVKLQKLRMDTAAIKAKSETQLTKYAMELYNSQEHLSEVEKVEAPVALDWLNPFMQSTETNTTESE